MCAGGPGELVVLGAGLVGSLCATLLAQKGYKCGRLLPDGSWLSVGRRVHLFERYGDIRSIPSLGRSINLSVTSRGLRAIREMGGTLYDDVLGLTTKVYGRIIHTEQDGQPLTSFQRWLTITRM